MQCGPQRSEPPGGAGGAQILLQTEGEQRQPLLGVAVPDGQIPAGLPQATLLWSGGGQQLGDGVRDLVQPPAPPQRHSIRDARSEAQRSGCRHRPPTGRCLRTIPQLYPRRWSRSTRCWHQPEVVCINPPPPVNVAIPATLAMAA
jgi:hypothetical protein